MTSKTGLVAQREYLENVRTKTFWIGILAFPVLIAISVGAGFVLNKLKEVQSYSVVDLSDASIGPDIERRARTADFDALARLLSKGEGLSEELAAMQKELGPELAKLKPTRDTNGKEQQPDVPDELRSRLYEMFQKMPPAVAEQVIKQQQALATAKKYKLRSLAELGVADLPPAEQQTRLGQLVKHGKLFAYFVIGSKPNESLAGFDYVSNNFTDASLRRWYSDAATKVVQARRIAAAKIPTDVAVRIKEEVDFFEKKPTETGATEKVTTADKGAGFAPIAFVYLLWIAVFTAAQMLLTNTVEEKSNRIIEVLLSSVSPGQLMAGKIWGIGATGMTLTLSWVVCAFAGMWIAQLLMPEVDLSAFAAAQDPLYLLSFILYFLFGYLLYAAILVGLGSVCNSLKEAQNLLQPVFILLIVPLVSMFFIVQEPNGLVAKVLSYVPLFTPFTMMNRAGGPPEVYEYAITGVLLIASVWFAFKAAGKVFRVGVLMTGNPPKLKEILGWLREK